MITLGQTKIDNINNKQPPIDSSTWAKLVVIWELVILEQFDSIKGMIMYLSDQNKWSSLHTSLGTNPKLTKHSEVSQNKPEKLTEI